MQTYHIAKTVSVFIGVSLKEILYSKALRPTQHSTRCFFKMLSRVRQGPNPCKYVEYWCEHIGMKL